MAVDESNCRRVAMRKFSGEAQAEMSACHTKFVLAHLIEDARAVTEDNGNGGRRVPNYVAEAPKTGEIAVDLIPIGMEGHIIGRPNCQETLRGLQDGSGIGDVELESCAGSEWGGNGDRGLVQLAGVVNVGVERGDGEGGVAAGDADALPGKGRRDLQWNVGERSYAVVANGDGCAHGNLMRGGVDMHVEIEVSERDSLAFSVRCRWRCDRLTPDLRRCGTSGGRGLPVLISRAREDDCAVGLGLV